MRLQQFHVNAAMLKTVFKDPLPLQRRETTFPADWFS